MKKTIVALGSVIASSAAMADDTAVTTAINSAVSAGQSNFGLIVVGLIGLGAIGFGLNSILSAMRS